MKKEFKFLMLGLFYFNMYAAQEHNVIPNASYYIYNGAAGVLGNEILDYTGIKFYSYNGKLLAKTKEPLKNAYKYLDCKSRQPMPVGYKIVIWPELYPGCTLEDSCSGEFIIFYDRHKNIIANYRYEGPKPVDFESIVAQKTCYKNLSIGQVLDLSLIFYNDEMLKTKQAIKQNQR